MNRRLVSFIILLLVLFAGLIQAVPELSASADKPVRLVSVTQQAIILELTSPAYQIVTEQADGKRVQHIRMPGADEQTTVGRPRLPQFSALLGVPPHAQLRLRVLDSATTDIQGSFQLPSVPPPPSLVDDFQLDTRPREPMLTPAHMDPDTDAELTQDAWMRDQRVVRVALHPFRYTPASGRLVWSRHLRVEVSWDSEAIHELPTPASTFKSRQSFETALQSTLLNYDAAKAWRATSSMQPHATREGNANVTPFAQPAPPTKTRYKIVVDHDGVYQLRYADLSAAGVPLNTVDPQRFRLTSQGQDVAIQLIGAHDGRFDPEDVMLFYGEQFQTRTVPDTLILDGQRVTKNTSLSALYADATTYTAENVYWLDVDGPPGPRMAVVDGTPNIGTSVPTSFRATVRAEESLRWWTWHFTSRDSWLWERIQTSTQTTRTYSMPLTAIDLQGLPAIVRGEVIGRFSSPTMNPDHRARFMLNTQTTLIEDATWDGVTRRRFEGSVPVPALRAGQNDLLINLIKQPGASTADIFFDWFEIEYSRLFQAEGDQLMFPYAPAGRWQYVVPNFSSPSIGVYDITNPLIPRVIDRAVIGEANSRYRATFEVNQGAESKYLVVGEAARQTPKQVSRYIVPDLHSSTLGADYIIITHAAFLAGAQELAEYRAGQGLRTKVIDVDDIYNTFNDGIRHPVAIKRFLTYAYANWRSPAPIAVVLVGGGHFNPRGYNPTMLGTAPSYMLPNLAWVDPTQGEVDSTNLLAAIVGDDVLPDVVMSRIPVNSAAEMQAFVAKIKRYEAAPEQAWQKRLLFVADNTPDAAGDFVGLSDVVINTTIPADVTVDRLYINDICGPATNTPSPCPNANTELINRMNTTGALFVNYVGHGSLNAWAAEKIFTNSNITSLNNGDQLPIMLSMTCLDGYWTHATQPGLIEELVRAPDRGAIAAFSPTGYGVANGHDIMHRELYTAIFEDGVRTLGLATAAAKIQLFAVGGHDDLMNTFVLFGDPALKLPLAPPPAPSPSPTTESTPSPTTGTGPSPVPDPSPSPTTGTVENRRFVFIPVVKQAP